MSWKHQLEVEGWHPSDNVTLGVDSDGDIGIMDKHGYSIILSPRGATQLLIWLQWRLLKTAKHSEPPEPAP